RITGNMPRVGRIGLAYFASPKGKILTEMTVTRLAENDFWLMTGAGAYWHDRDLLIASLPASGSVTINDVTRNLATLLVTGPKAPAILA
ncbi:aminomethyl transferase family protein, partial [Escherichia coli]|nr:aminomethyl transferase family protein [Escherichia coli]